MDELKINSNSFFWQTKSRGTNEDEYQIYCDCVDNGEGIDITTNEPIKTYEEWLNLYRLTETYKKRGI